MEKTKQLKKEIRDLKKKIRQKKRIKKTTKKTTTKKQQKTTSTKTNKNLVIRKDGSVDIPASILSTYSGGFKKHIHPQIVKDALNARDLPDKEQKDIVRFLRAEARKFKGQGQILPQKQELVIPQSLLQLITSPQHQHIVKKVSEIQSPTEQALTQEVKQIEQQKKAEVKQAKKWATVQPAQTIQKVVPETLTKFQVGGREKLENELKQYQQSEGLKNDFKAKLNALLGGRGSIA